MSFGLFSRFACGQRLADHVQRFDQPQDLRRQWLVLHVRDHGKILCGKGYTKQKGEKADAHVKSPSV